MRAVLVAIGSHGDVVPFVALAERLLAAGHEVVLVTHRSLLPAGGQGVELVGIDSDPSTLLAGPAARSLRRGDLRGLYRARALFADYLLSAGGPTADSLDGADVVVASTFAMTAVAAARDHQVPVVRAHLWPEPSSLDGPMPLLPYSWLLPGAVRRSARSVQRRGEPLLAGFERRRSGRRMRVMPTRSEGFLTTDLGSLYAYSPALVPAEVCAPAHGQAGPAARATVTGWWTPRAGGLSAQTRRLLDDPGPPWLFVGFGSMPSLQPGRLLPLVEGICRAHGLRAVVQLGSTAAVPSAPAPPGSPVRLIGPEPHDALLPRMALAVHHGGAGTTGAVCRAGIPSVVVPHMADQFYWAHRLHALGVAPVGLPSAALRAPAVAVPMLSRLVARALSPRTVARARALGDRVREEDGVGAAVRWLEDVVGRA